VWKNSKRGLRVISFCVLFLVLGLSFLPAIPQKITGSAGAEQILLLQSVLVEKEELIESISLYVNQLETQLEELMKMQENSKTINLELENLTMTLKSQLEIFRANLSERETELEKLKVSYNELEKRLTELTDMSKGSEGSDEVLKVLVTQLETQLAISDSNLTQALSEIETLQTNLTQLEELSGLSKESFQSLLGEFLPLQEAYDIAVKEGQEYYQDLVNERANKLIGEVGIDGFYYPAGDFGIGLSAGIGWGDWLLSVGAQHKIILPFDVTKITYSAGIRYRF
jgi:hypothetical protein